MGFAIVVDSTCDLRPDEYRDLDVTMVPLTILVDGGEFKDQTEISSEEFYRRMAVSKELPKTAAPSPYDFVKVYEDLAKKGYEHIVSLHLAGVLSGTVESARIAASQVDVDVRVIDTLTATAGMALLAQDVVKLRDAGATVDEAEAAVRSFDGKNRFLVTPETLENLLKGGRLSADQVKTASMLNVKPIFMFTETGSIAAFGKAKGMHGVVKAYVEEVKRLADEYGTQRVRFGHVENAELIDDLKRALDESGVSYIDAGTAPCGATVAAHFGFGSISMGCEPATVA